MERKYKLFWVAYIALILWAICALCSCSTQKETPRQKFDKQIGREARKFWRQK